MPIHPNARRCTHIRLDGKQCGSPAVTAAPYCHFHCDVSRRRKEVKVPVLQTTADVQQAITETIRALIEGRIDRLRANSILYGLQLAQKTFAFCSVKKLTHKNGDPEVDHSVVQRLLDEIQPVEEHEREQEAEEQALAEERAAIAADVANIPRRKFPRSAESPDAAAPHHWTEDIPRDDDGYLKLTKQQEDHLDRIVMGREDPTKTG